MHKVCAGWLLMLFLFICLMPRHNLFAQDFYGYKNHIKLSEENAVVVEVYLGKNSTSQNIEIYQHDGGYLVPLGLLSGILDFPIEVNAENKTAEGWFIRENRTFNLNLLQSQVTIVGETVKIDNGPIAVGIDDIYVDSSLFSKWFPIDLELNFSDLALFIKPREMLPVEEKFKRGELRKRILPDNESEAKYKVIKQPYKLYDAPFADVDLGYNYDSASDTPSQLTYSLLSQGDLAGMTSQVSVSGESNNSLNSLRANLGRNDYEGKLLGPMKATSFLAGDITSVPMPLVTGRGRGRGVTVSNTNLKRADSFDSHNFVGDGIPGWEVEIYRNGVLQDYQVVGSDGRYEFQNIPIFFGSNVFRIVSYGPQGQIKEKTETLLIDESILKKGEYNYQFSADDKSRSLFGVDEENSLIQQDTGERTIINNEYGFTDHLTGSVGFVQTPLNDGNKHDYNTVGLRSNLGGLLTSANLAYDSTDSSSAAQFSVNTRLYDTNVRIEQSVFDNFVSEEESVDSQKRESTTKLDFDGIINKFISSGVAYRFGTQYEKFQENRTITTFSNKISTSVKGIGFSNDLQNKTTDDNGVITKVTDGSFAIRGRYQNISLRLSLDYEAEPYASLKTMNFVTQKQISRDKNVRFEIRKDLIDEKATTFNVSLNKRFEHFTWSINAKADDKSQYGIGTSVSFSLGREPRQNKWIMANRGMASSGAVSARTYLDKNYNDKFDEGDEVIKDAQYKIPGGKSKDTGNGSMFISGLDPDKPLNVEVDVASLEDPFWQPKENGYTIVPRPGSVTMLDFPIINTTEIDGNTYIIRDGQTKQVPRVEVNLIDEKGEVISTTKSEFDGFYIFEGVVPGRYVVSVSEDSLAKLKAVNSVRKEVEIKPGSDYISGLNLVIGGSRREEDADIFDRTVEEHIEEEKEPESIKDGDAVLVLPSDNLN